MEKKLKLRDANVETFRCILMFIIVLYHCFVHGVFEGDRAYWTVIISPFLMWHVDGFVAISVKAPGVLPIEIIWTSVWGVAPHSRRKRGTRSISVLLKVSSRTEMELEPFM